MTHPPDPYGRPAESGPRPPGPPPHQPPERSGPAPQRPSGRSRAAHSSARSSRRNLLIAVIAVVAVLLIGGGVTVWLLLRDADRGGPSDPATAVDGFLSAVYEDHDPARAGELVCAESRDEGALAAKINGIRTYAEAYPDPRFSWSEPELVEETDRLAIMDVTITMRTSDEQVAEQPLRVSVLDKQDDGWWVCDIESPREPSPSSSPSSPSPAADDDTDRG